MTAVRSPFRAALAVLGLLAVAWCALLAASMLAATDEHRTYAFPAVARVELAVEDGRVAVEVGNGDGITVREVIHRGLRAPVRSERVAGGTLRIAYRCPVVAAGQCSVDYVIVVPAGTALVGRSGDGTVTLAGALGAIDLASGDGTVVGRGLASPTVRLAGGDGTVDLDLAARPARVDLDRGDGTVRLRLPAGAYALALDTGDGTRRVDVAVDPAATSRLRIATGDGTVDVRYR